MKKLILIMCSVLLSLLVSAQGYTLMWEDNFDNPVLNETQHWTILEGTGVNGWGTNEIECYRRNNIGIEKEASGVNCLVITAKKENYGSSNFTSGRLVTQQKVACKFGKIEARIKLPHTANGLWPAFWMMGDDISTVGWPKCGEIDIMEMGGGNGISRGLTDKWMSGALHSGENWDVVSSDFQESSAPYGLQDDFHLYTLIWDETSIKMYLDLDKYPSASPYYTKSIAGTDVAGNVYHYFHKPFHILLNLAVGGDFMGIYNSSGVTALPTDGATAKMYVDYVRIYQKGDPGDIYNGPAETVPPTGFTASKGAVTSNSVELLLNGTDNSGTVVYYITYNTTTLTVKATSGVEKAYKINGLNSSTAYNFSVIAKDVAGNVASNNPIIVNATTSFEGPSTNAPTPTVVATKVVSIFSDAYSNAAGATNFNPGWGQTTTESLIQVGTDNVLKYANLNYQGTEFGNHVNVADMKYMHVDVYSSDETVFQITPISPGQEKLYTVPTLTQNSWNSYEIPLSYFSNVLLYDLFQIKSVGFGGKTVYLDNIYFYTDATADTQVPTAFTATASTIVSDGVTLLLNATDNSGAVFYDITYNSTTVTTSWGSGLQKSFAISGLTGSTNYSFSIVARDRTGNAVSSPIVVPATTLSALPAAPTPTFVTAKVMSLFSDAYTNVTGANFDPGWGGGPISDALLGGNTAKKYDTFSYKGVQLASAVNASTMTKLHIDIYPTTETSVKVSPINTSKAGVLKQNDTSVGTLIPNQWNSFNIALAAIGVDMSAMDQFIFSGGTGGTFYMDNLYLFNDSNTSLNSIETETGISCYPNPVMDKLIVLAKSEISEVIIRNLLGQSVKSTTINSTSKSIDLSDVTTGNYSISVKLANGQLFIQKFVKL